MNLRHAASRVTSRSYGLSKRVALTRMRRSTRRRNEPPIVVFSMGKTGSTAVARAAHDATGAPVFQVFRLDPAGLAQAEARYCAGARPPFRGAHHLWESAFLLRDPPSRARPWTVITTVREPIAQAVSAYFHGRDLHGDGSRETAGGAPAPGALVDAMVADRWVRTPLRWFDREFAPAFGLDALAQPFDPAAGSAVIETPAVRVLLLRQESLGIASEALGRFLGRPAPVPVPPRNVAAGRGDVADYRAFLDAARFPAAVVDEAYASRYARHFYADEEIERFRRRWLEGADRQRNIR